MPLQYNTPGVYIQEVNAPHFILEVPTAIPVFIGYTEQATLDGVVKYHQPIRIHSLLAYEMIFGKGEQATLTFSFAVANANTISSPLEPVISVGVHQLKVSRKSFAYRLYANVRLFFLNGGVDCYIISIGEYTSQPKLADFSDALATLKNEPQPSMLVIPDAVSLSAEDHASLVQSSLVHCDETQNRVAILDVYNGAVSASADVDPIINIFRNNTGDTGLGYGVAYFPWLKTGVVSRTEINFNNLPIDFADYLEKDEEVTKAIQCVIIAQSALKKDSETLANQHRIQEAQNALLLASTFYNDIMSAALSVLNVQPPSAAMAGCYAFMDTNRSVSTAPANSMLAAVMAPTINLTDAQQMGLNVCDTGKSVNAIRAFPMRGVLAWGAKTLDGNNNEWKYINVRRTMIMLEQSIKSGLASYVFEPNNVLTWTNVKALIENFLMVFWRKGGLVGSKPAEAFIVAVGLGETMSAQDILNGYMRVTVMVAISHPAEFMEMTFEQPMPSA